MPAASDIFLPLCYRSIQNTCEALTVRLLLSQVLSEIVHKQIDISIKSQFLFVLKHIAYTFRNIIYGQDKDENNDYNIARAISNVRNHKPIIELVTRPWNNLDAKYWGQFGVNPTEDLPF